MKDLRNVVLFMALVYGLSLFLLGLYVRGVREDVSRLQEQERIGQDVEKILSQRIDKVEKALPSGWRR